MARAVRRAIVACPYCTRSHAQPCRALHAMNVYANLRRAVRRRWHGEVPAAAVFWRDMVVVGSLVNLGASIAALMLAAAGAPLAVAALVHFAPLPYNTFLLVALWRLPFRGPLLRTLGLVWWAAACLL